MLVLKSTGDASSGYVGHRCCRPALCSDSCTKARLLTQGLLCRYGPDAAQASKDMSATMYSGAKAGRSVMQMRNLGLRPVATRIARRTAKGVAKSYVKPVKVPAKPGQAAAGAGTAGAVQ